MIRHGLFTIALLFLMMGLRAQVMGQQAITDRTLARMITHQDSFLKSHTPEKLYLQTDKPNYTVGDTLRFKAYLLNADYLTASTRTGLLYVEIDDQNGKVAKRLLVPVSYGQAWGNIALDESVIPSGSYTLRAYTNWMRNFGNDYIFEKHMEVSSTKSSATLVKANFKQEGNKVEGVLQFASLEGRAELLKDMELKVMAGKKNLSKTKLNTGIDGVIKVNFDRPLSPSVTDKLSITAKNVTKGITDATELIIPVTLNRLENTDMQFMPEGGSMIAGIPTKVGFKAISEDGKGNNNISGNIINSKQQQVAAFKTSHAGMGSFEFTPQAGESYTAIINGITKTFSLPAVKPAGIALRVQNSEDDSLKVIIRANNLPDPSSGYYLIGQARGVVCYAQKVSFKNNRIIQISLAKKLFPTGIARFTLIDANRQPLTERQLFINHYDELNISIATPKNSYGVRDSVALAIEVKDKAGNPVQGVFSLAVTDDSQVKTDSLGSNIWNNLLLTSDLKGNIEQPGYYFDNPSTQKQADLDNLMLTQGWIGYDWKEIFKPVTELPFKPEKEFTVKGKVTNVFNKPIAGSSIILLTNKPLMVKDTLTNKDGQFIFKALFPVDTAIYKLQARNKRGKEFNVGIAVDAFKPPVFAPDSIITPWYVNSDAIAINAAKTKTAQQQSIANYRGEGNMLAEVTIKDKKTIKGSSNLNGPGEADFILDQEAIEKAGQISLTDLLWKKVPGFTARPMPLKSPPTRYSYTMDLKEIHFVIDGIDLDYYYPSDVKEIPIDKQRYEYLKGYLDYFTSDDIAGIEVMMNPRYNGKYSTNYLTDPFKYGAYAPYNKFVFIEITTRSKSGPFLRSVAGTYLYKALPFTLPKQFYSPKYTVNNKTTAIGTDMRSTLHWEPNVITDKDGKAMVSFFTADKIAKYTLILEGLSGAGDIGYHKQTINSSPAK